MPVPLALVAPAVVAGGAYLNAKFGIGYDYRLLRSSLSYSSKLAARAKIDRISLWYVLEDWAISKHAGNVLVIFQGRSWTYKEVYDASLKYGTWLKQKHGVKPKDVVAMDFRNSEKFLFVWLGLWAIGAKPAFINYNLTGKALAHCIKVAGSRLTLVDFDIQENITQEVRDELPDMLFEILTPETEAEIITTRPVREPNSARSEDETTNMAILIYTSGTTGLPKGAIVSWAKVTVASGLPQSWMSFKSKDIFYTCMPLYHSAGSVLGFSTVLSAGATLSLGQKFSTKTFWSEVRSSNATVIQYVGETCRYLLSAPPQIDPVTQANLDKVNSVRLAFGNGLRPDIWNRFKERFGIEAIAEFYSATEGAGGVWNYSRNDFGAGAIGRLGSFSSFLLGRGYVIVDLDWETEAPWRDPKTGLCKVLPRGETGELLYVLDAKDIKAKFQGYYNNPSSTSSKVIRDVKVKGDAYFRTGDMISWDSEGRFYFNDRIGDTFRWKSENVSTNEVSEALGTHPSVVEANVYGVELPHHDGRAGCVALILSEEPSERLMGDLARHVRERLPRFAVPVFLRLVSGMELTGTNKQQKAVVRKEGVDTDIVNDDIWWLKGESYRPFGKSEWEELKGGRVRL